MESWRTGRSHRHAHKLATLHHWLRPGELLQAIPGHPVCQVYWAASRSDSFAAPDTVLSVGTSKAR